MKLKETAKYILPQYAQEYCAEEKLLYAISRICSASLVNQQPFSISVYSAGKEWRRRVCVGDSACTLFIMEIYEHLFNLSLDDADCDVFVKIDQQNIPICFQLHPIPYRTELKRFFHFHREDSDIVKVYNRVVRQKCGNDDLFSWLREDNVFEESTSYEKLKRLALFAIYGESQIDAAVMNNLTGIDINEHVMLHTVLHPRVLMQRLKMAIYLREEILNGGMKSGGMTYCDSQNPITFMEQDLVLGDFSFFSTELRSISNQFAVSKGKLYVLDQRYGTIGFCVYQRVYSCSSIRPYPLLNVAEKLILDINECVARKKEAEAIRILIVGSIEYAELINVFSIFETECDSSVYERIHLEAWSPILCPKVERKPHVRYRIMQNEELNLFAEKFMEFDIVFLVDIAAMYSPHNNVSILKSIPPAQYQLSKDTLRNDIIHAAYESGQGYLNYEGKLSLRVKEFISEVKLYSRSAKLTHLCVLLSYSEQTELMALSRDAHEVRKEIVSQGSYTTLLRYQLSELPRRAECHDIDSRIQFVFRLNQWYKMTSSLLPCWTIDSEDATGEDPNSLSFRLDRLLNRTICKLSINEGAGNWQLQLIEDEDVSKMDSYKQAILQRIKERIIFGLSSDQHVKDSVRLAQQALANLLIARSVSKRHLVFARSMVYQKPKSVIVVWGDSELKAAETISMYDRNLRQYHTRYSDYLILCSIDKAGQNIVGRARTNQLLDALGYSDGYEAIGSIRDICLSELPNTDDEELKKYLLRIISQADFYLSKA